MHLILNTDGWGTNSIKSVKSGYFRVLAWKRLDNWCIETRISESKEIRVIADFDNSYVTVEVHLYNYFLYIIKKFKFKKGTCVGKGRNRVVCQTCSVVYDVDA